MICHSQGAGTADTGGSKASEKALWPVIAVFVWWSRQAAAGRAQVSLVHHAVVCVLTNVLQVLDISNIPHTLCMWRFKPRLGHQVQSVRQMSARMLLVHLLTCITMSCCV